jgi:hypothetical protein
MPTQTIEHMVRERPDIAWEVAPLLPERGNGVRKIISG